MRVSQPRCKFIKHSEWFHCRQLSQGMGQGETVVVAKPELNRGLWQPQLQLLTKFHVGVPLYKVTLCALCTSCDFICCPAAMPANFGTFHISSVCDRMWVCVYMKLSVSVLCFPRIIFGWSKREKNKADNEIRSALFFYLCRSISIELKLICARIYILLYHMLDAYACVWSSTPLGRKVLKFSSTHPHTHPHRARSNLRTCMKNFYCQQIEINAKFQ